MKLLKTLFFLLVLSVSTMGCSFVYGQQHQYDPAEYSTEDFYYLDRYSQVEWSNPLYLLQYSYYDIDRVFIVIYGNRVYIIPYEYFWHYIYPHFRGRIIWRSYDYLVSWWGYHYYNSLWNHWYRRHLPHRWHPGRDWYYFHRKNNRNNRFIVKKDELSPNLAPKSRFEPKIRPEIRKKDENPPKNNRIYAPRRENPPQARRSGEQGVVKSHNSGENRASGAARARKKG